MYKYKYPRAALTTDAIVYCKKNNSTQVLLIQRGIEPFLHKWALPGGFVNMDETLEEACKRELAEETGLMLDKMQQFRAYDAIDRDPRHRTISVVFSGATDKMAEVSGEDDAINARWFPVNDLPELAFDHGQILTDFFDL